MTEKVVLNGGYCHLRRAATSVTVFPKCHRLRQSHQPLLTTNFNIKVRFRAAWDLLNPIKTSAASIFKIPNTKKKVNLNWDSKGVKNVSKMGIKKTMIESIENEALIKQLNFDLKSS